MSAAAPVQAQPQGAMVVGTPRPPKPKDPPSGYRWGASGELVPIPGGPADPQSKPEKNDPPSGYRWGAGGALVAIPGGPADKSSGGAKEPGVEQGKAAGYYSRAAKANQAYESKGVGAESPLTSMAKGVLPDAVEGYVIPDARLAADANARGFITSVLRYESGAAIPPEEFASAYKTYFPQPGEGPDVVEEKRRLRAEALEALKMGAGPAAEQVQLDPSIPFERQIEMILSDQTKSPEERLRAALALSKAAGRPINEEQAAEAAQGGGPVRARQDPSLAETGGLGQQFQESFANTVGGLAQGAAALPDAFINASGGAQQAFAELAGMDGLAETLRNRGSIGGAIERVMPTSQAPGGSTARFLAQLGGGVASLPARATTAIANKVVGQVPARVTNNLAKPKQGQDVGRAVNHLRNSTGVDVRVLPADVGGAATRMMSAGTAKTLGGIPMANAADASINSVAAARGAVAAKAGQVTDETGAGQAIRRGAAKFMDDKADQSTKLYNRIQVADDAPASLASTRAMLGTLTNPIKSNPELSSLMADKTLKGYLDALSKGGLSWADLKAFRSKIGEMAGKARFSDNGSDVDLKRLYGAISSDMEATAKAAGPKVFEQFKRANRFHRAKETRIESVLAPILGKVTDKGDEAVFQALNRTAQRESGNAAMASQAFRSLPADEAGAVRATLISKMGQNRAGDEFSPTMFVSQWGKLSDRAKAVWFSDRGLRQDLDALATLTGGMKAAQQYANTSNTGLAVNVGGLIAGGALNYPAAIAVAGMQYGAGKLMSSPAYVRWLMRGTQIPAKAGPTALQKHVSRLSAVAQSNPALADDIARVQQQMMQALNDNFATSAGRSVASGQDGRKENNKQPQSR